jgi:hypothetical protein
LERAQYGNVRLAALFLSSFPLKIFEAYLLLLLMLVGSNRKRMASTGDYRTASVSITPSTPPTRSICLWSPFSSPPHKHRSLLPNTSRIPLAYPPSTSPSGATMSLLPATRSSAMRAMARATRWIGWSTLRRRMARTLEPASNSCSM